jgi:signal transduction histidine kinase
MNTREELNFEIIFESVPGLYLVLKPDFTIVAVSQAYLNATMTSRDQIIGKNLFDVFPDNPDDPLATGVNVLRGSLNEVLRTARPHTMAIQKYDIRKPDGEFEVRYWSPLNKPVIGKANEVIYIIHRVEDVTEFVKMKESDDVKANATEQLRLNASAMERELYNRAQEIQRANSLLLHEIEDRKIAEEKLRASQLMLQATMESHKNVLIFSIDKAYRYLNFNKTFQASTHQAYGTRVEAGASLLDTFTNELDKIKAKINCDRALAGESHITIEEYGDVHRLIFETRYDPIFNDAGDVFGITVLSSDITERKLAEEQIQTLNKELDAFTYSVAHDLRAPLRVIDGYCDILKNEYRQILGDEGGRLLKVIEANGRQMGKLIDDLLNFSRLGKLPVSRQHVDINSLVIPIIDELLILEEKKRPEFKITSLHSLNCDSSMIRHVLSNLIANAIKYSRKREKAIIEIGSKISGSHTTYFIKDNGSGFDMQYVDKLFGVFQRLHKPADFEGTGVGLAIVQRIIVKHGGKVWAEGVVDQGATFYFSIPHDPETVLA